MRVLAALAALSLSLAASPALAQGRPQMRGAVLVGIEDGDFDTGFSLRGDLELVQRPLAPNVGFSIVGSVGFSRFSQDGGYYDPPYYDDRWETAVNVIKIVPAARLTFGRSAKIRPYVDAGLGLYYASLSIKQSGVVYDPYTPPYWFSQEVEYDDSETSILMRLAAGLTFDVSPRLALGAEVGITPYFGDFDDNTMSLLFAAQFRL